MDGTQRTQEGIGASVIRKEDARHLHGRGQFVGDIALPGMLDAAIVRSPAAHARLRGVRRPAGSLIFTAGDLALPDIMAPHLPPAARQAAMPVLAKDRVRYVGEPVAVALAPTRARAEDLAETVELDLDPLPVAMSVEQAAAEGAAVLHDGWPGNQIHEFRFCSGQDGALPGHLAQAPIKVEGVYRMARQSMNPMEGKGCLAYWDDRQDQLILHTSTQIPHLIRDGVSDVLGLPRSQLRVIAPDVGGGFGYKSILQAEEVLVCWLARRLRRPVRWLEDRREHLIAAANTREQLYRVTAYADRDGRLLGVDADIAIDAGAYSVYPFTNLLDAGMAAGAIPGPYDIPWYRSRSRALATNKPPVAPYRGVARPGACFAIEQALDAVARQAGRPAWEVRLANLIPAQAMPYTTLNGRVYDSGDYPEALRRAVHAIRPRARQAAESMAAREHAASHRIGVGVACFVELTGHGMRAAHDWKLPVRPAPEPATVRLNADGTLEVRLGLQSHGQGMETTMAQVAHEILGLPLDAVRVLHGDTGLSAFSTGTYASRGMVMGGGAVAGACRELARRLQRLGAVLLDCDAEDVAVAHGRIQGPSASLTLAQVARIWHEDCGAFGNPAEPASLEVTHGYELPGEGAFSYGAHAAVVDVDLETGYVRVVDYLVVEDCGVAVNPMIVDGQVMGGVVQGIGSALYEESLYDAAGQPQASTLVDYLLPSAGDVPFVHVDHLHHPSPFTEFGMKGVGEGGAIPSASVVCSAVNDALGGEGACLSELPLSPARVLRALADARRTAARHEEAA
ncbi:xanthine dehydrogenase family protein molybdopterin-binding subunit [Pigmentiphaga sp. H8]|uniref:xanthine dehydrogenase family protein molybdopterin-binding subunit n=1 Tax=Pigmentiphaga sp. H8 TaxID=2488560 RepID=UPI000F592D0C|nr:xanthine dehydrogenase family protein molybdopterin-binding subunit [Pigmentiphaga sp. H8]AZG11445.1 xanthine dehydrogenase family protein molybdopterin-binding subunit [Pigmentiphaga sp. H8]